MPVDEFGREIPGTVAHRHHHHGPSSARAASPSPPQSPQASSGRGSSNRRGHHGGGGGDYLYPDSDVEEQQQHYHSRGSGGGRSSRSSARRKQHRPRSHSRHQSPSPPSHRRRTRRSSSRHRAKHASEQYAKDPMLCEYVWKDQVEKKSEERERDRNKERGSDDNEQPPGSKNSEDETEEVRETYDEYRRDYCLTYVRSFFNEHMDDSWFRKTYSPLEKKRAVLHEQDRAAVEARAFSEQASQSPELFVKQARLGNGVKEQNSATGGSVPRKRKYSEGGGSCDKDDEGVNVLPASHVLSTHDRTLILLDVPPHVTDKQLSQALSKQCATNTPSSAIQIYSEAVSATTKPPLIRRAYTILPSVDVFQELLLNLKNAQDRRHHRPDTATAEGGSHVPRKEDDYMPKELDLDVDCSDPFGRVEIDEDGKGGGDGSQTIPPRKCTVVVSTLPPRQQVTVLSAAVSSVERIPRDKGAAVMMARALDVSRSIPTDVRLDRVLETLLPSDTPVQDILDVTIAYLRRVHLFSFYNGCNPTTSFGQVLSGHDPTSTIHLRLKGADEMLKEGENTGSDLLVMRLDDSISKALEESTVWVDKQHVLDEARDAQAAEIEELEDQAKVEWIENHGIVDDDGRARCSFHFCRKLFKDDNFLKKHLFKKHGDFLKAEQAKCHDAFMMKQWDEEANRPVPPVLVDCGANFGLVPSQVVGAQPMADDPEPGLWAKEEEKRKRKEEERERFEARERFHERRDDYGPPRPPRDPIDDVPATNRLSNFVDVDDMKEEKVELSFENVDVVAPPAKKKRKKKKLL